MQKKIRHKVFGLVSLRLLSLKKKKKFQGKTTFNVWETRKVKRTHLRFFCTSTIVQELFTVCLGLVWAILSFVGRISEVCSFLGPAVTSSKSLTASLMSTRVLCLSIWNNDAAHSCCSGNKPATISNIRCHASRSDTVETCVAMSCRRQLCLFLCGLFDFDFFFFLLNCSYFKYDLFFMQICWRQPDLLSFGRIVKKSLSFSCPPRYQLAGRTVLSAH